MEALLEFLRSEAAGGALLILASIAAVIWANSPYAETYAAMLSLRIGHAPFAVSLHTFVNDGLMSLFFLLAGLEIRREMTTGQLATLRGAAAPAIAAAGGMAMPALIYIAFNHGEPGNARGWAVPVATDIAFSLAALRVLGNRASFSLRIFLSALAIIDDLGAILIIAMFYSARLSWPYLAGAAGLAVAIWAMRRTNVCVLWPYLAAGAVLWLLVYSSGIHATLSGVALAFLVPSKPGRRGEKPVAERFESSTGKFVAFAVLPAFGLMNAGVTLKFSQIANLTAPASLGVILALFLGKQSGVFGATMIGKLLGLLTLPPSLRPIDLYGASVLCGIGFTMSLFIADLAFRGTGQLDNIKLAIFCGSIASAAMGLMIIACTARKRPRAAA